MVSSKPRSCIAVATGPVTTTHYDSAQSFEAEILPISLEQIMLQYNIAPTYMRSNNGQLGRHGYSIREDGYND